MTKQIENYIAENLTDRAQLTVLEFTNYLRANELEIVKDQGYWKDKIYYLIKCRSVYVLLRLKTPMNRKIFGRYGLTTAKHTKLLMWKKR